jgi:hypothetical protein
MRVAPGLIAETGDGPGSARCEERDGIDLGA